MPFFIRDERTTRARQDYEQARGTAHKRLLQAARQALLQRLREAKVDLEAAGDEHALLLVKRQKQLKQALAKHLVKTRLIEVPGIGARRHQQILRSVFRDSLFDLHLASQVPGIGKQTQLEINRWIRKQQQQEAELLRGDFPGKSAILRVYGKRLQELGQRIADGQAEVDTLAAQLRRAEQELAWLEPVTVQVFQQALKQPEQAHPELDRYVQGVFAEWETAPDWFRALMEAGQVPEPVDAPDYQRQSTDSRAPGVQETERRPFSHKQVTTQTWAALFFGSLALGCLCMSCAFFATLVLPDPTPTPFVPTFTATMTATRRATATHTATPPPTASPTPTAIATPTLTPSATPTAVPSATAVPLPEARVSAAAANVRAGPGVTNPVVAVVEEGARLRVLGQDDGGAWLQVQLDDGTTGWIGSSVVERLTPQDEEN